MRSVARRSLIPDAWHLIPETWNGKARMGSSRIGAISGGFRSDSWSLSS